MKIAVAGIGYVGLSMVALLARNNAVCATDILRSKVDLINQRKSPIEDKELTDYLSVTDLDLSATADAREAFLDADLVIVCTPTNYDDKEDRFDTSSVEDVIEKIIEVNKNAVIVIKSTVPIGYTMSLREKFGCDRILFSPEFLREGKALYDNLHPSRIIVGAPLDDERSVAMAKMFSDLLKDAALDKNIEVLIINPAEAEAVKLFANTYLAMRVSFFNELDTFAELNGLNSAEMIKGVCLDPRIGDHYNNPSFGYGGYCLPKDTKQLLSNYNGVPNDVMRAIVLSNDTRKDHVVRRILDNAGGNAPTVGIYRITAKTGSDNFRYSSVLDVMEGLHAKGCEILIFEPSLKENIYLGFGVISDLREFKERSDIIVANRSAKDLDDVSGKVYTRDIFLRD